MYFANTITYGFSNLAFQEYVNIVLFEKCGFNDKVRNQ